ncbi:MAG: hypothetical protein IJ010_00340 [Ruminococcus sp.]|nr:hypothetical protein [Ruminococcus sp.]
MKKKIIFIFAIIIFCSLAFVIRFDYSKPKFYDKTFVDTSHENSNVLIRYPQINAENQDAINNLIRIFAENIASNVYGSDYVNLNLVVEKYNVTYYDENLLSIVFEANGNVITAAYPNNFLYSINIDIKNESIISLSDIYSIDDDFSSIIYNAFNEQFAPKKLKEWGINEESNSYERYKEDLSHVGPFNLEGALTNEKKYYLQENSVIICVTIPHAIGDYFQIEVKYSELNKFLKRKTSPFIEI